MLPTPDTSHVDFSNVYEPSEDSYLLLDALSQESEKKFLADRFADCASPLILEVGSGSGIVTTFVTTNARAIVGHPHVLALSTDVNNFACRATAQTVSRNLSFSQRLGGFNEGHAPEAVFLDAVNASLTSPIKKHEVDILIFNPPYVPSENVPDVQAADLPVAPSSWEKFKRDSQLLALATDGGEDGMQVTKELLSQLPDILHPSRGVAYILLCAQNHPEQVKSKIENWGNEWLVDTIRYSGKQGGWEKLEIIRVQRNQVA